jgi:spermidine/putrescine transport system substrate-binding protein
MIFTAKKKVLCAYPMLPALAILLALLTACAAAPSPATPPPPPLAAELVFYDWAEDQIATTFDQFTEEYGVKIRYEVFESTEEAVENIRAGKVYDVVVMENQFVPVLAAEGLLAKINYQHIPNFKYISPNFRDLVYDPQNEHSIPYTWGSTGLIVRTDLAAQPITAWADMWQPAYAGQVVNWETLPRYALGAALKTLGYSVNSENPAELEESLDLMLELKHNAIWLTTEHSIAPLLIEGRAVMGLGWSEDYWLVKEEIDTASYVIPQEGAILWGDNYVIPANSPNQHTAELFLDFLLRPQISAQTVNSNYYPSANEAAKEFGSCIGQVRGMW